MIHLCNSFNHIDIEKKVFKSDKWQHCDLDLDNTEFVGIFAIFRRYHLEFLKDVALRAQLLNPLALHVNQFSV